MNLKIINREKNKYENNISEKKLKKILCWMVKWIKIVCVLERISQLQVLAAKSFTCYLTVCVLCMYVCMFVSLFRSFFLSLHLHFSERQ